MAQTFTGGTPAPIRRLLWLTLPIAAGAIIASLAGLFVPSAYGSETINWATQGRGQDAANLVVYASMLALAWAAARGSLPALLSWLGLVAYSAYSYLLYAGWVHFGPLFLVYVATFGLSTYALIAGLAVMDPVRVQRTFDASAPHRGVGVVLMVLGGLFAVLWLSEILPATLGGTVPQTLRDAGLATNPVWVLDLAIVLPAMILAGSMLRRDQPLGYLLAVPLLVFGIAMGAAIVAMFAALALAGEPVTAPPAVMISVVVGVEVLAALRMVRHQRAGVGPADALRSPTPPGQVIGHAPGPSGGPRPRPSASARS